MKTFVMFSLVGCFSLALVGVQGLRTPSESDSSLLDDILRKITTSILNAKASATKGFYEVADDGSIHFVRGTTESIVSTSPTTTSEPDLSDDESVKEYADGEDEAEGTLWEFVPHRVDPRDPLNAEEFPLVDTNEVESDEPRESKPKKFSILERSRRDVNVDVGGSHGVDVAVNKPGKNVAVNVGGQGGSYGSHGVDVAVNKPGHNVAVNVGGIQEFLGQFGIHFNGGKPSGSYASGSAHGGNVDVDVGGKPGHGNNVDVSVQKPHKGNTNVAVDWASFIPFVNVGVNKKHGGSNVDVNVGQNGGSSGSLVDVKVNKGEGHPLEGGSKHVVVRAPFVDVNVDGDAPPHNGGDIKHKKKVVVHAPFVDIDVDGDFPPPPPPPHHPPHYPPKKHHYKHHAHEDDGDKNVSVNVGGQSHGSWWPFVNVAVDSDDKAPHGKAAGKKCVKINVPFVNVLLNRGCEPEAGPTSY